MTTTTDLDLMDADTAEAIRPATITEYIASVGATTRDGGAGIITVDGRRCYVTGERATITITPTVSILIYADEDDGAETQLVTSTGSHPLGYLDAGDVLDTAAREIADLDLADRTWSTEDGSERYLQIGTWVMTANTMGGDYDCHDCGTVEAAQAEFAAWVKGTTDAIDEARRYV